MARVPLSEKPHAMKKAITLRGSHALLLAGALCLVAPAKAQETDEHSASDAMNVSFGAKGGVNWSNLWVKEVDDRNPRLGFHLGLFTRFASSSSLGVQLEALYDQKGTTIHRTFDDIDQEITYKFDYITMPLLIVVPMGEVMELHAGGYLGYMIVSEIHRE